MTPHPVTPVGAATAGPIDVGFWRTSSFTGNGSNCVEVAPWRTSSFSNAGQNCVEIAPSTTGVLLRDTKDHGAGPVLSFTAAQWTLFLREIRAATASANGAVVVAHTGSGTSVRVADGEVTLHFTFGEWTAFRNGVCGREFDSLAA